MPPRCPVDGRRARGSRRARALTSSHSASNSRQGMGRLPGRLRLPNGAASKRPTNAPSRKGAIVTHVPGQDTDPDAGVVLRTPQGRWVLAATVLGSAIVMLDATVVNVAL